MQITWQDLLLRAGRFMSRVLTLMAFLLSTLISALSGLCKALFGVFGFVSGVFFTIPFCVREFVDAEGFFKIIHQCSFDAFLASLASRN